jgi:two-component system cell cycle response regulator
MPSHAAALNVLLVEDNEDHAFLARAALEDEGHRVRWVTTANAGLELAQSGEFDAVAVDYRLPDSSGVELLVRIRRAEPDLPVVIVTSQGSEQVAVEAMRAGAGDYVVKTGAHGPELVRAIVGAVRKADADRAVRAATTRLRREAATDALTGLANRRHFEQLLPHLLRRTRAAQTPLALALMDINGFKAINDTFGHVAGDQVLAEFAAILARCTRKGDLAARYGGDEFVVVMPNTTRAQALGVTARIRSGFAASPLAQKLGSRLSVSIGLAEATAASAADLVAQADSAMYAEKNARAVAAVNA